MNKQCKGDWAYQLISNNGKKFLAKGKLSKSFWQRFENDYLSLTRKRQGHYSAKRVFACKEAMVRQYLDDLAEELIWTGIFMNVKQIEPGVWTGSIDTSLASYKMFAKAVKQNKVQKPVVVLTDGHSSRYDADVMQFCRKEDIHQFMGLPDTTELTQLLDQVFANLRACYSNEKKKFLMERK